MAVWHGKRGRIETGKIMKAFKKKRKYELGRYPIHTKIGKEKRKIERTKGGEVKIKAISVEFANVLDKKTNTIKKVKILGIQENPANPHFVRHGIITKGCTIKTEIGLAKVTSRPSQEGIVNALLIEEKSS